MRNRRDVLDGINNEPHRLQRTQSGFTSRTRALDQHLQRLYAMFLGLDAGIFRGDLRGIRRGFARTLEPFMTGRRPGQSVPLGIGNSDNRIVEGGIDMRDSRCNVFALLLARFWRRLDLLACPCFWFLLFSHFLIPISTIISWLAPFSCRQLSCVGPCACAHWYASAGRGQATPCGG